MGSDAIAVTHHRSQTRLLIRRVRLLVPVFFALPTVAHQRLASRYRLIPMGSFSRIEKTTGDKSSYELHGSGDLHFGRLLHNRRFDFAMVAFLECLKQITDYAKSQDSGLEFPHQ